MDSAHPAPPTAAPAILQEAAIVARAPRSAAVAGLLFAVLFAITVVALRTSPLANADDATLASLFDRGADVSVLVASLYLAPFAGIAFLWFVAVVRDQIGELEDRFFATVFFGSGLLFVALLFAAAAVIGAPVVAVRYLELPAPSRAELDASRALAYTLLFVFATRAGAVCLISMSTLGLRTRRFPRWMGLTGAALGLSLLLVVGFWDWYLFAFPAWVAVLSLYILRRARAGTA